MNASPAVGTSSVARIRIAVVLPAPLGPINPITWPGYALNETPSTARSRPKCRCRLHSSIAGVLAFPFDDVMMSAVRSVVAEQQVVACLFSCQSDSRVDPRILAEDRQVGARREASRFGRKVSGPGLNQPLHQIRIEMRPLKLRHHIERSPRATADQRIENR